MNTRRPSLTATYSEHHTTVYVQAANTTAKPPEAVVFCQLKNRACRRDSWSHTVHTGWFNVKRAGARALCLREPTGHMPPTAVQGRPMQSPIRETMPPYP